ncbi:MAG: hypothetical protein ACE366_06445 [Bradymonadia bacterium]
MNRESLAQMLGGQSELTQDGDTYTAPAEAQLAILLASQSGGPATIGRVSTVHLGEGWLELTTTDERYCLPYEAVLGLRLKREAQTRSRAGFTA